MSIQTQPGTELGQNTIFCYSGTGNSLATARQIANELGAEIKLICAELGGEFEGDAAIFVYPVYAYGMPMEVKRFIKRSKFKYNYCAIVTTCGSRSHGAITEGKHVIRRRGQKVQLAAEVRCVENYVHMFALPAEDKIKEQVAKQETRTAEAIEKIKAKGKSHPFPIRPFSAFVRLVFRSASKTFAKHYKVNKACTGCGICARLCPSRAITMAETKCAECEQSGAHSHNRPVFNPKICDHCQACLQLCPRRAIQFGKITPDGRRYKHPAISTDDLFKR